MNFPKQLHLPEFTLDGYAAKAFRVLLSIVVILFSIAVIASLLWAALQFLPWVEPYLRRFFTSVQIGWGLISVAGLGGLAAAVIIWRA